MNKKWYAKKGVLFNRDKYVNYSTTWCNANAFVNEWGNTDVLYIDNKTFSERLKKGHFISYDKQRDGDWDHVGFVVDVKKYDKKLGYSDYKVAQHTNNYCAWASSSKNGWDELSKNKKVYYRVFSIK